MANDNKHKAADENIDLDNPEFANVWKLLNYTNRSVFLTGKAGTGKSTFLRYIVANIKKKAIVLAPTGIAAVNAGGQTLHSFFKIPLKPILPTDPDFAVRTLRKRMKYSQAHIKLLRQIDIIVIDEISMVRADVIDFIDRILRVYCQRMREPFGGKQLLLVGDIFQLEPVVTGDARDILAHYYRAPFFFNADAFRVLSLVSVELRKVYRQDDSRFVALLDRVRAGQPTAEDIASVNSRLIKPGEEENDDKNMTMTIATRRDMVDNINQQHLDRLTTKLMTFKGQITGDFPTNSLPTDIELSLKVGAQVVFIKNDPDHKWVNGTIGVIDSMNDDVINVRLESGNTVAVEPDLWENIRYTYNEKDNTVDEEVLGSFSQMPLKLAWALTIHKSQGLTFNRINIDLGRGAFTGGQTYVALSRCRSLEGIRLNSTLNLRDIFVNRHVLDFASTFNDHEHIVSALESSRANELYLHSAQAFDKGDFNQAVELFYQASKLQPEFDKLLVRRLIALKLGRMRRLEGEIARLRTQVEQDRQRFNIIADDHISMGNDCAEAGEYQAALANYRKALEFNPDSVLALQLSAQLQAENGEADKALSLLETALKIAPDNIQTLIAIGDIYNAEGDIPAAMDHFLRAYEADKSNQKVLRRIIALYESTGDKNSAQTYRQALRALKADKKPRPPQKKK